jgi:hypothetical protein
MGYFCNFADSAMVLAGNSFGDSTVTFGRESNETEVSPVGTSLNSAGI